MFSLVATRRGRSRLVAEPTPEQGFLIVRRYHEPVVGSIKIVAFGGFLLVAGLAVVRYPLWGEFNIGHERAERALGRLFGVLSILIGAGLVCVGL